MAEPQTSAARARAEMAQSEVDDLFANRFGDSESPPDSSNEESSITEGTAEEDPPSGPPLAPPSAPPSGPPSGPPQAPPSAPPSGPPSGPPLAPPSAPPSPTALVEEGQDAPSNAGEITPPGESEPPEPGHDVTESPPITSDARAEPSIDAVVADAAMLTASEDLAPEVERLRRGLVGAADAIEDLEKPRMPPVIGPEHVIPAHVVADFVRIGRNLAREGLIHANVGAFSMIDPDAPGIVHATRQGAILARLTDQDLISGMLGGTPPEGHDPHWSVHEVLLASLSLQTEGRAACLHVHGPWTTTVSCEKDRIVCAPIDQGGKSRIGRVIIVDPDPEDAQAYLRQVAEALKQSQMVGVVVRGNGAFVIGRNFDEAWSNASVLEHSMHILLLAKQANLKI